MFRSTVTRYTRRTKKHTILSMIAALLVIGVAVVPASVSAVTPNLGKSWYSPAAPPPGYLNPNIYSNPVHVLNNETGIMADLAATTGGDYCNSYKAGINLLTSIPSDQSPTTGFTPYKAPGDNLGDWQEGDISSTNVCQAREGTWGFKLSGAANNNCSPSITCGMHHFARLPNGSNNQPWSSTFGDTSALTFSATVTPKTVTGSTTGYICPILQEIATGNIIELCDTEWRTGTGFPKDTEDNNGVTCYSENGINIDTVWTFFRNDRLWSTKRPGSADTYFYTLNNSNVPVNFTASISANNIKNVVARINTQAQAPHGCFGHHYSNNAKDYALIGFEDGVEGGGYNLVGESVTNECFSTTTDALFPDDILHSDQTMYSANYSDANRTGARIVMQSDGNLVVYPAGTNPTPSPIWASASPSTPPVPGSYLQMQADGNLVIYKPDHTNTAWHRQGTPGSYMNIQNDGNFVMYLGSQSGWNSKGF